MALALSNFQFQVEANNRTPTPQQTKQRTNEGWFSARFFPRAPQQMSIFSSKSVGGGSVENCFPCNFLIFVRQLGQVSGWPLHARFKLRGKEEQSRIKTPEPPPKKQPEKKHNGSRLEEAGGKHLAENTPLLLYGSLSFSGWPSFRFLPPSLATVSLASAKITLHLPSVFAVFAYICPRFCSFRAQPPPHSKIN